MKSFFNFLLGAVTGALLGGSLALLLAPSKGEQFRKKISEFALNIKSEAEVAAAQKRVELEKELATLRNQIT